MRAAILVAALALAGCDLAPSYSRPAAPVPARWPGAEAGAGAVTLPWQTLIVDARLRQVIEAALENNRDLRATVADVEAARVLFRVERWEQVPDLVAGGSATFSGPSDGDGAVPGRRYDLSVGIGSFEIDLFGRLRNASKAAFERYLATEAASRSVRISLIAETATAYVVLAADIEQLRVARETMASAEESLEIIAKLDAAGLASKLDLRQAETVIAQARADVARFATRVAQDRNALELLVGAPVPDSLLPDGLDTLEAGVARLPAGLSSEVLLQRPDVLAAEHRLRAANADIGVARAALFPRISLTAALGFASSALSSLFEGGYWSAGPSASLPIFGGGERANVDFTEAQRDVFVARYERAIQVAFREVADALARARTIDEQRAAQADLVAAAQESFELATARYRGGVDSYLNALSAQRFYYSVQQSAIDTEREAITNRITLYRVIGSDPFAETEE